MARVISQAGDSTDGEDYEIDDDCDFVEDKINRRYNKLNCTKSFQRSFRKIKVTFNISTSYALREIANLVLQTGKIRDEYKRIKAGIVPEYLQEECRELDKMLGRKWSTIVENNVNRNKTFAWKGGNWRKDIYEICKEGIEQFFKDSSIFKDSSTLRESVKEEYKSIKEVFDSEKDHSDSIERLVNRIQNLHKEIENFNNDVKQRNNTELLSFTPEKSEMEPDASKSLARLKAGLKLDNDQEKIFSYDCQMHGWKKMGYWRQIVSQKNETLTLDCGGTFMYHKTSLGSYLAEASVLAGYETDGKIDKSKMKGFMKSVLRGKLDKSILINEDDEKTINRLTEVVELIFGIEIKRNSSALLTGPMFFDLENAGVYKMTDLAEKMPMAMSDAVASSRLIGKLMKDPSLDINMYYNTKDRALELARREETIVQDWLKFRLKTDVGYVDKVPAIILNDLIFDWYGIELVQLKEGEIKLDPLSLEEIPLPKKEVPNGTTSVKDSPKKDTPCSDKGEAESSSPKNDVISLLGTSEVGANPPQNGTKNDCNTLSKENLIMESPAENNAIERIKETPSKKLAEEISTINLTGGNSTTKTAEGTSALKQFSENLDKKLAEEDDARKLPEGNSTRKRPAENLAIDSTTEDSPKKLAVDSSNIQTTGEIPAINLDEEYPKNHCCQPTNANHNRQTF